MNFLISIIMPLYNAELFVEQAIESIISQSYPHWELIIIDDGSTDNSFNIASKFSSSKIHIYQQKNNGQCAANNFGFSKSRGDYIKFMDADDLLSDDFLKLQVDRAAGNKNIIISSDWGRFYNDDLTSFRLSPDAIRHDMKPVDWLCRGHTMMQCALWLIPREVLEKSGLWNEKLSLINDFEFFIRVVLCANEVKFANNAVLYYRSGIMSSLSNQKSRKSLISAFESINQGLSKLIEFENSERTNILAADIYKEWSYQFYPTQMDLYKLAVEKSKDFGQSSRKFQAGGYTKILSNLLGWKLTKRIKNFLNV